MALLVLAALVAASLAVPAPVLASDPPNAQQFTNRVRQLVIAEVSDDEKRAEIMEDVDKYAPFLDELLGADGQQRQDILARIARDVKNPAIASRIVLQAGRGPRPGAGRPTTPRNEVPTALEPNPQPNPTTGGTPNPPGAPTTPPADGRGNQSTGPNELGMIDRIAPDRGRNAADVAVELDPNNTDNRIDRGIIYFRTGDDMVAYQEAQRVLRMGRRDPPTLLLGAQAATKLGDYETANALAAEVLNKDPNNRFAGQLYEITRGRASKIDLKGKLARAGLAGSASGGLEAIGEKGSAAGPAASAQGYAAALGAGGAGGPAAAAVSAGEVQSRVTAAELAAIASQKANVPASRERQSSALTREAHARITLKDFEAARMVASQAIELNPRNAQAWTYRAVANTALNKLSDAVYDASFALKLVPGNTMSLQTRSWAFNKQKLYRESLADATATIEQEPNNAEAHYNASWAYAGMGQRVRALESLERAAKSSKRFEPIYQAAIQAPENADLLLLFQDQAPERPAPAPGVVKRRFLRFALISLSGGLLIALAVLHLVSASWREKVHATVRRVLGGAAAERRAPAAALELAGAAPAGSQGIWSQYTPVRTLGQGGMGIVYEAVDRGLDRTVAVKKMRDEIRTDPGERQRFVTEARMVAGLHHPNIVEIYSIVEDAQDVYLVFEYVPGTTLADRLKKGALDLETARRVLSGACAAVEHAHNHNVIHRDLKPSNIMLTESGEAKVMDFGVARQAKDAVTKMALTNTIVGTPPYMAPEQEQGSVRKESDVFALGVCFFEMLTGELPFAGVGAGMLLNKINGRFARLSDKAPGSFPPALDDVLAKALAGDPDKRYRTPSEFIAAVEALVPARLA